VNKDSEELSNILARLGSVERENRRLKRMVLGVLVLVGAVLLMGQARPTYRIAEAERFALKDATGRTRARLEMDGEDRPTLALLDASGFPLVSLAAGETPTLVLCRATCENQVVLGTLSDDLYGLALYGKKKGSADGVRAGLGVFKGEPGLTLYNETGTEQAGLNLGSLGPTLTLRDPNGFPNATLTVGIDKPNFWLFDKQGFSTIIGSTDLETPRTGETHKTSAASIVLSGKDGKTLWTAP